MGNAITFTLGPVAVRISGAHRVTQWARRTFGVLETPRAPDVTFEFTEESVHPVDGVGDEHTRICADAMSFAGSRFDTRISLDRASGAYQVMLRDRDRRSLMRRTLADPEESWKMWLSHGASLDMHGLKDFAYNTSALPLTCALLDKGASLIHAGAISVDGQGVLMPAWGGVGKSLLVSRSVLHGRAKFLADDHAVIDRQGDLHLHLLPIHVYKYHTSDAVLAQRLLGSLGARDRLNWRVGCRLRPRRAVRWVAPQTLYTEARLERTAQLNQVVLMFRGDHLDFVWEEVDPESGARCCAGVLFDEIRQMAERLALGAAGWERGPLPQLHDAYAETIEVLTTAFGHGAVHRVLIPRGAAAGDVVAFVRKSCPLIDQAFDEAP